MSHLTSNHIFQFLEGTLDPSEQQRLSAHVAVCPECRQELALQRAIAQGIKLQPPASTSPRFTEAVMRRVIFYERHAAFLQFLMQHGVMLALIVGLSILFYAFSSIPVWEVTKETIHTLEPEKKMTQYYIVANREIAQYLERVGEKIINLAGEENAWLFVVAAAIIVMLALFDRLVVRQFMRIRS
jgi:hypothetical protein